jgi:tetratricopeptide (TPR) repeat protein
LEKHIFISYTHDDSQFALQLIQRIEAEGFKVWIDHESQHLGDDWRAEIDQAIRDACALIVILSPAAESSSSIIYQWAFACGSGIAVIPVMSKSTRLHPRLEALHALDFTGHIRPWESLVSALKAAASPSKRPAKRSSRRSSKHGIQQESHEQGVQEWINLGELFLQKDDGEGALAAFKQAMLFDESNARAYVGKSTALYMLARYQEALVASEQAIQLDPGLASAWSGKGDALYHLHRYQEARVAYEQAIQLDPSLASIWNGKDDIFRASG